MPDSTMLQEEPVIYLKTQKDGSTTDISRRIQLLIQPSDQNVTDQTRASYLDVKHVDVNPLPQRSITRVDDPESSPGMSQGRVTGVLPVQPAREEQNPANANNDVSNQTVSDATNQLL